MPRSDDFARHDGSRHTVDEVAGDTMKRFCLLCVLLLLLFAATAGRADDPARLVMLLDPESGDFHPVAPDTEFVRQGSPVFSPDESLVAFDARRDGEPFRETRIIVKSLKNPDEPVQDLGSGAMPSYSKSGREIAFSLPKGGGVWIMGASGHGEFQLRSDAWHIAFSPVDENIVAYGVRRGPNDAPNIVLHDLDTDDTRFLVPAHAAKTYQRILYNFQWSRDGTRIAFKGRTHQGEPALAIVGTQDAAEGYGNRIFTIDLQAKQRSQRQPQLFAGQPKEHSCDVGAFSADGKRMLIVSSPESDWKKAAEAEE